jgi:hypothetical protein
MSQLHTIFNQNWHAVYALKLEQEALLPFLDHSPRH